MDTMEGALVEPAAVGMHAAMLADVKPGKEDNYSGSRSGIGLMTLQAANAWSNGIVVVDVLEKRLIIGGTTWCDSGY